MTEEKISLREALELFYSIKSLRWEMLSVTENDFKESYSGSIDDKTIEISKSFKTDLRSRIDIVDYRLTVYSSKDDRLSMYSPKGIESRFIARMTPDSERQLEFGDKIGLEILSQDEKIAIESAFEVAAYVFEKMDGRKTLAQVMDSSRKRYFN